MTDMLPPSANEPGAAPAWPPAPIDGPTFVITHKEDWGAQRYGSTYIFSTEAGGAPRRLITALEEMIRGAKPVYLIIYRPGPLYAFTAWARVAHADRSQSSGAEAEQWTLTLEHHEFPVRLDLKGNAQGLMK